LREHIRRRDSQLRAIQTASAAFALSALAGCYMQVDSIPSIGEWDLAKSDLLSDGVYSFAEDVNLFVRKIRTGVYEWYVPKGQGNSQSPPGVEHGTLFVLHASGPYDLGIVSYGTSNDSRDYFVVMLSQRGNVVEIQMADARVETLFDAWTNLFGVNASHGGGTTWLTGLDSATTLRRLMEDPFRSAFLVPTDTVALMERKTAVPYQWKPEALDGTSLEFEEWSPSRRTMADASRWLVATELE
jgi:hypothetical protein